MSVVTIEPKNVNDILWILNRRKCSWLPQKSAILLEKAFQGTATGAAIQPNCDFVYRLSNGWIEHEEQRSRGVLLVDWYQPRVHLANVEIDIGQRINLVLCDL